MKILNVGDKAPDFEGTIQNGKTVKLSDYKGKKLVLYFYPKDNTPGCTTESCNLADNYKKFQSEGYEILGVSADDEKSHNKFIDKYGLPFNLIADTERKVIEAYGCWGPKKFMGKEYDGIHRKTFVIDENSMIASVFEKVVTKDHANQILSET
jgi:peroxiredoxin Q/BCP